VDKEGFRCTGLDSNQHQSRRSWQHRPQCDQPAVAGKTKTKPKKGKAFLAGRRLTGNESFSITDENSSQPVPEEKGDTLLNTTTLSNPVFSAPIFDGNNSFENAISPVPAKPKTKSILQDTTNRVRIHGGGSVRDKYYMKYKEIKLYKKKDEVNVKEVAAHETSASVTFGEPEITFVEETVDLDAIKSLVNRSFDREEDVEIKHARRRLLFAQTSKSQSPVINNKSESIPATSTKEAVENISALGNHFNYFYAATEGEEASFTTIGISFDGKNLSEGNRTDGENYMFEIDSYLKEAVEIFEDLITEMANVFSITEWQTYLAKIPNKFNSTCHELESKMY